MSLLLNRTGLGIWVIGALFAGALPQTRADWPQWGGSSLRNSAAQAQHLPVRWQMGALEPKTGRWLGSPDKQIKWVARLGSECYGSPVVADGKVFCATNNGAGYLARYPAKTDLGCLLAFAAADGRFLWQLSREKLPGGQDVDWPSQGICCAPLVEGKRLWIVTNRGEVLCLDSQGSHEGKNEASIVWGVDMPRQLQSVQRYMCSCSVTAAGDLLLTGTSNGADTHDKIPAPDAPSFVALDKRTGAVVWTDNSPGRNILEGQWASPAFAVLGGVPQAIFGGGDGWLYSFLAEPTSDHKAKLLWKFDCNPKDAVWEGSGSGARNHLVATPLIYEGKVYIGTGQDPQNGEGPGDLWCIDPTKRGDVSAEVVVDKDGKSVPAGRLKGVDADAGQQVRPSANSAAIWHYRGSSAKPSGGTSSDFQSTMHRTLSSGAIQDGLLVVGDLPGLVHCLDAATGKVYWTHDMKAELWGGALIADGKIYLGTGEGDVVVFALSKQKQLLAKNEMGNPIFTAPAVADNVLYFATRSHLVAIRAVKE
jgi:outer membrane protein assembly factor BamB